MKRNLFFKLAASFAAVLLLFTMVLGTVFLSLFRSHTIDLNRTSMEEKAVSIAQTLSSFEGVNGRMSGYGAYLRFLDELAMAEVWIVDDQLNVITQGHHQAEINKSMLPENAGQIVAQVFAGELTYGEEFSELLGTPSLTVGAPITVDGYVIGAVLLHAPVSGINHAVRQGSMALAVGSGIALLLAGLAAALLSYRFTRPLTQMKNTALLLAGGDYTVKTGVTRQDEIGQLASVMDELSRRLCLAQAERDALDKLRESFVANVSHELRTPVAVLRGSLENLIDGAVSKPVEVREYYGQMLSESCHLERLVNDLLELSRLQDEGFSLEMAEVNLCDVVWDATRAIRRRAQSKEITVQASCPQQECIVMGDYGRIRQLLLILLDNAVKFSPRQSVIEVTLMKQDGFSLAVTDKGIGIPSAELPFVFDRFHKTNLPTNKNGTGLGLAIAKEIASRHKAEIYAKSDADGTCFTVFFSWQLNPS